MIPVAAIPYMGDVAFWGHPPGEAVWRDWPLPPLTMPVRGLMVSLPLLGGVNRLPALKVEVW